MKKTVVIQVAMKEEGLGLAQKLNLIEGPHLDSAFGFRVFEGTYGSNLEIKLVLQGTDPRHGVEQIGLEAAAVCAVLALKKYTPDLLLNFGTAGAFVTSGFAIGEVALMEGPVKFHDRRVPIPGYFESQEGNHPVSESAALVKHLKLKRARISSGSSLELSARDSEMLRGHGAPFKEMEAAGIAWVAHKMGVSLLILKSVTDFIDSHEAAAAQFLANLALASENVQLRSISVLQFLDQNLHDTVWTFRE